MAEVDPCDVEGKWMGCFESVPGVSFCLKIHVRHQGSTVDLGFFVHVGNRMNGGAEGHMESGKGIIITRTGGLVTTLMGCPPDVAQVENLMEAMIRNLKLLVRVSKSELCATYEEQGIPRSLVLTQE